MEEVSSKKSSNTTIEDDKKKFEDQLKFINEHVAPEQEPKDSEPLNAKVRDLERVFTGRQDLYRRCLTHSMTIKVKRTTKSYIRNPEVYVVHNDGSITDEWPDYESIKFFLLEPIKYWVDDAVTPHNLEKSWWRDNPGDQPCRQYVPCPSGNCKCFSSVEAVSDKVNLYQSVLQYSIKK